MSKKVGYARVAVANQNVIQQMKNLKQAGCKYIFTEKSGGGIRERDKLQEALAYLSKGDVLVIDKLNILGYSITSLIDILSGLHKKGIGFKSLQDNIDSTEDNGEMLFNILRSLAEYERDVIQERTHIGLIAARARGRNGGRPKALEPQRIELIKKLHADKTNSITNICKMFKISRPTLYAYLKL